MGNVRRTLIAILLLFATVFTSVGYAQVSDNLSFFGTAEITKPWYDLYISNITPDISGGVDVTGYYSTYMSAEVGSSKLPATFTITVKNESNKTYVYERTIEGEELGIEGAYVGTSITPAVSGITFLQEVPPGGSVSFTLTLTNTKGDSTDNYYLKFNFIEKTGTEILPGNDDFNVTFKYNNGQPDTSVRVHENGFVPRPETPVRNGYDFIGWYTDSNCTNAWNFEAFRVTANMTLYAGWRIQPPVAPSEFRVTYRPNNGDPDGSVIVKSGELAPIPSPPTKSGYDFIGWYKDEACTDPWNFDTDKVYSNMTLYGGWEVFVPPVPPDRYITFKPNNGEPDNTIVVLTGEFIPRPTPPTKPGYVFTGWYVDESYTMAWNFEVNRVESDMTLYAGWDVEHSTEEYMCIVTFYPNNGTAVSRVDVKSGELVPRPAVPTREGYTFIGWYYDSTCTIPWNFDTDVVTEDTELYAGWELTEDDGQDEFHGDILGLIEALLSTRNNCLNNNDMIYDAVYESLNSKKRPKEDAPILHSSVNSVAGGTITDVATYANSNLVVNFDFLFEVDPDPAYRDKRMRIYVYYTSDIRNAKAGDEIPVYQQIVTRGDDGVWFADGTYIGTATVGYYFGGGNNGKDVWTIDAYSWKFGGVSDIIP